MVIIIDLQCIGPQIWLVWIEWVTGPMLVMNLSLFAYVSNRELAKYFTYHFLIASYFGGNSVAPRNPTLFINIHGNFTLPFNLPESPTWVTLVIFFHTLKGWCLYVFYTERRKCSSQWTHKHHFPLSLKKTLGRRLFHFYQERRWSKNEKKEGFGSFLLEEIWGLNWDL